MTDDKNAQPSPQNDSETSSSQSSADARRSLLSGLTYYIDVMKTSYNRIKSNQVFEESRSISTLPTSNECPTNPTEVDSVAVASSQAELLSPAPFAGVFKKKSDYTTRSKVDMKALAHPVYAPNGAALDIPTVDADGDAVSEAPRREQVIRLSPFS